MRRVGVLRIQRYTDPNARYCPQGHPLTRTCRVWRERLVREAEGWTPGQPIESHGARPIVCDGCARDITEGYIAGSCQECDIDFCSSCFESSQSIDELLEQGRQRRQQQQQQEAARGQHYNGRRPSYQGAGRVNYDNYLVGGSPGVVEMAVPSFSKRTPTTELSSLTFIIRSVPPRRSWTILDRTLPNSLGKDQTSLQTSTGRFSRTHGLTRVYATGLANK